MRRMKCGAVQSLQTTAGHTMSLGHMTCDISRSTRCTAMPIPPTLARMILHWPANNPGESHNFRPCCLLYDSFPLETVIARGNPVSNSPLSAMEIPYFWIAAMRRLRLCHSIPQACTILTSSCCAYRTMVNKRQIATLRRLI